MTRVEIEYCVPCGFLERAERVQHALLERFGEELDAVALVTGAHGVFHVDVDGETVYDKDEADEAFDVEAIVDRVADAVGAAA
ncbi:SelT/SelW/SelH family protein [Haloplanus sp. GCM10025708]|uniref:SelT/SelW/SelH family protein n=1 Tax=Haloferacaceae TaxID=1644056 RepID=UPI0036109819